MTSKYGSSRLFADLRVPAAAAHRFKVPPIQSLASFLSFYLSSTFAFAQGFFLDIIEGGSLRFIGKRDYEGRRERRLLLK